MLIFICLIVDMCCVLLCCGGTYTRAYMPRRYFEYMHKSITTSSRPNMPATCYRWEENASRTKLLH